MDTSEEYIKMCDCPEIQGERSKERIEVACWATEYLYISKSFDYWTMVKAPHVWLPRQDQMQEMLINKWDEKKTVKDGWDSNYHRILFEFYHWLSRDTFGHPEDFGLDEWIHKAHPTFEQLWLAFYMLEEHEKKWNGKWVLDK